MQEVSRPSADAHDALVERARAGAKGGDEQKARVLIDELLRIEPGCPHALVLLVSLEMGKADLTDAVSAVERLERAAPDAPEARVARALVERRGAHPDEPWLSTYRAAWNAAGRPDLRASPLLGSAYDLSLPDTSELRKAYGSATGERRLALALADPSSDVADLEEALRTETRPEYALMLVSRLYSFADRVSPERLALRDSVVERFASAHDTSMQFPLVRLLAGSGWSTPLTDDDVVELERIAALASYSSGLFEQACEALHAQLVPAGIRDARYWAFIAALGALGTDEAMALAKRMEASMALTAERRDRIARAAWRIGEALLKEKTLLQQMVAVYLVEHAAKLTVNDELSQRAQALRQTVNTTYHDYFATNLSGFPIAPLREEALTAFTRDEAATMRWLVAVPEEG